MRARPRRAPAAVVAALAIAIWLVAGSAPTGPAFASNACASATAAVLASVDAQVTTNIYSNELAGREVSADLAYVTGAQDLISAVSDDDAAATLKAVKRIVYHPGWHIVRLRVLDASGRLLADLGGPDVVAPVSGALDSPTGTQIGSFVMSVQDDVGLAKLERRFVGDPIGIYYKGRKVAALGGAFPRRRQYGSLLTLGARRYHAMTLSYDAFPSGTLHAVLAVPPPTPAVSAQSCDVVRAGEFGLVAMRLTDLLGPFAEHYYGYAYWVHVYTGGEVFVRAADGTQLASSDGSDPASLPLSGQLSYEGQNWLVFSFAPEPQVRVYLLVSPAPPALTPAAD